MCRVLEELMDDEKREIALRMLEDGKLEEVVKYLGFTLEQVEELSKLLCVN